MSAEADNFCGKLVTLTNTHKNQPAFKASVRVQPLRDI